MKKSILFITILVSTLVVVLVGNADSTGKQFGKLTLHLGEVEIKAAAESDWVEVKPKMLINENDVIRTQAKSRCEITLVGGGKVRIGEKAELEITEASVKPMEKKFNAKLNKGNQTPYHNDLIDSQRLSAPMRYHPTPDDVVSRS